MFVTNQLCMLTKLLWFVTAVTIQGGYLPSSCQIDTASSAVYIALYPTNRSLREDLIDTLSKTFFSIPHFNSGIHHFTHFTAGIDSQCRNYLLKEIGIGRKRRKSIPLLYLQSQELTSGIENQFLPI